MTTSNLINPKTGQPYKVGDVLATEAEGIAFAEAVGWDIIKYIHNKFLLLSNAGVDVTVREYRTGDMLPYTIIGFLPGHTATATTPNPPLTFDEAIALESCWVVLCGVGSNTDDLSLTDLAIRRGAVYAHDPAEHPPTEREANNKAYQQADPWLEPLRAWYSPKLGGAVSTEDALEALDIETGKRTKADAMRVGECFAKLGLTKKRVSIDGKQCYRYQRDYTSKQSTCPTSAQPLPKEAEC